MNASVCSQKFPLDRLGSGLTNLVKLPDRKPFLYASNGDGLIQCGTRRIDNCTIIATGGGARSIISMSGAPVANTMGAYCARGHAVCSCCTAVEEQHMAGASGAAVVRVTPYQPRSHPPCRWCADCGLCRSGAEQCRVCFLCDPKVRALTGGLQRPLRRSSEGC
jgi:hypothetical protein